MAWTPPSDAVEAKSVPSNKGWEPPSDAVEAEEEPYATDDQTGEKIYAKDVPEYTGPDDQGLPDQPAATTPQNKGTDKGKAAAFGYGAASNVAPGVGGLASGAAAAAAVSPLAEMALAVPVAGPVIAGALELGAFGVGSYFGAEAVGSVTDKLWRAMDPKSYQDAQATMEAHPGWAEGGGVVGGAAGLSPRAMIKPGAKIIDKVWKARAASGATQAGVSIGTDVATGKDINVGQALESAAVGAALPGVNRAGKPFAAAGEKVGNKIANTLTGKKATPSSSQESAPTTQPTPEEQQAAKEEKTKFLEQIKAKQAERDAQAKENPPQDPSKPPRKENAHLVEAAIKNRETNEIERMGPKHDEERKAQTLQTHDQGFVDENGDFLTRKEAVDRALKTGQITAEEVTTKKKTSEGRKLSDVVKELHAARKREKEEELRQGEDTKRSSHDVDRLEKEAFQLRKNGDKPPDYEITTRRVPNLEFPNEGLHSGDLRKAGDKRFEITKEQPAGEPKKEEPKPKEEPPFTKKEQAIDKLRGTIDDIYSHDEGITKAKTAPELLTAVENRLGEDHYVSRVLRALEQYMPEGIRVHILDEDLMNHVVGETRLDEATPAMFWGNDIFLKRNVGTTPLAAAHELAHGVFHEKIEIIKNLPDNHKQKQKLTKLVSEIEGLLEELRQKTEADGIAKSNPAAMRALNYAMKDVHEFISDGMFKPVVMRQLMSIEKNAPKGVFSRMVQALADFFGLDRKDYTALHELLRTANNLAKTKISEKTRQESEDNFFKKRAEAEAQQAAGSMSEKDETKLGESTTPKVASAAAKVDVRTIPNKEAFLEHAANVYHEYGEDAALQFFEDYKADVNKRQIPVPHDQKGLDDALHKLDTWQQADKSEHVTEYKTNTKAGITKEQRQEWFDKRERGEELPPEAKAVLDAIDSENLSLVRKAKSMGLEVGEEFATGQSRIRIQGGVTSKWKKMISELFANRMPFSEKVADQANAAHERKVFQLEDGRVVEIHRVTENAKVPYKEEGKTKYRDVRKGTELWEWKDGNKRIIGHTENLEFKKGEEIILNDSTKAKMVDGKVDAIEEHSPYRYLHDAEASARLANMGLRKMVRDAELIENLKKSDLFKTVAHGPNEDLKNLPPGWKVPNNIDKIPQLRGYHFDPKTAAIIEDFAKVWENNFLTGLSNQVVKNMMLNPLPHMWNEVMHLYNARGFTGWVDPRQVGRFASTGRAAWKDVTSQSQFYRDIMREGGAILGADPRNQYFDKLVMDAGKEMFSDEGAKRSLGLLAKKLGTTVGDLYNGISRKSQQAMWVARDTMYVQYIREIQRMHPEMSLKQAIDKAEKHMPNYRMPSEVLGSRGLAKVLKNPNVTVFSRYHYGMLKSLVNTVKDINPKNLKSQEGRQHFREGVDSMLAIGVAMSIGYPLMDMLAQQVFGDDAEVRRAGPYHMIKAIGDVASGEKDATALIWPVFTFNPALLVLGQLLANKKIFSGKEIYHPQDSWDEQLSDVAEYGVKQIPQAPGIMGVGDEGGGTSLAAKQLDIKVQTPAQREKARTAKKRELAATKSRETKRKKGTYNP